MEINTFLTDEFIAFSSKIKELHERRKKIQDELRKLHTKLKEEISAIDAEVANAVEEFEKWKLEFQRK